MSHLRRCALQTCGHTTVPWLASRSVGLDFGLFKDNKRSQPYGVISRMSEKNFVCIPKCFYCLLIAAFTRRGEEKREEKKKNFLQIHMWLKIKLFGQSSTLTEKFIKVWMRAIFSQEEVLMWRWQCRGTASLRRGKLRMPEQVFTYKEGTECIQGSIFLCCNINEFRPFTCLGRWIYLSLSSSLGHQYS